MHITFKCQEQRTKNSPDTVGQDCHLSAVSQIFPLDSVPQ